MSRQQGSINKPASFEELLDYQYENCEIPDAISEVIHIITSRMCPHECRWLMQKEDWRKNKETGEDETIVTTFMLDHTGKLRAGQHREVTVDIDEMRRERMDELVYENMSDYMREFDFDTVAEIDNSAYKESLVLTQRFVKCVSTNTISTMRITRKYEKGVGLFYALRNVWDAEWGVNNRRGESNGSKPNESNTN